ncbi:3'-5' exonuclease [Azospirillum argentinense]
MALAGERSERLFFTGDLGQRIFQQPFSWKSLGVDVRGHSHTLKICYRTSHQIRTQADRLLPAAVSDVDGHAESRKGTISLFDGPPLQIATFASEEDERDAVALWIAERLEDGVVPKEIAVFVRSEAELGRACAAVVEVGAEVLVGAMHAAKGLEFRAVAVIAYDDEMIPSQDRIAAVADDADLEDVYDTERHLLYVACTCARDHLLVTGIDPASEFLADMVGR